MKLFVGLGNPGPKYSKHRHNIGFAVVDVIAADYHAEPWRHRHQSHLSEASLGSERVLLLKPQTFMNNSGRAVFEALKYFNLSLSDLVVFHDELDLEPMKLRVKIGGGVAGHNGLKSLAAHLHSRDFKRVRIGIGHPGAKHLVNNHVLGSFSKGDLEWLGPMLDAISDAAPKLADGDDAGFMNRVAVLLKPNDTSALNSVLT
ncbi:MAG: aminoacyl-tRNA hydrolase [Pseudomonadota bacterium]